MRCGSNLIRVVGPVVSTSHYRAAISSVRRSAGGPPAAARKYLRLSRSAGGPPAAARNQLCCKSLGGRAAFGGPQVFFHSVARREGRLRRPATTHHLCRSVGGPPAAARNHSTSKSPGGSVVNGGHSLPHVAMVVSTVADPVGKLLPVLQHNVV